MGFYRIICCGNQAGSPFDHSRYLCAHMGLCTGRAPCSAGWRGCFTALTQQLSKTEQHKYLCVEQEINRAFFWRTGGVCFIMLCLQMFVNTASSCHTTAKIRIQSFKASVEAWDKSLFNEVLEDHSYSKKFGLGVWVCPCFCSEHAQLREVRGTYSGVSCTSLSNHRHTNAISPGNTSFCYCSSCGSCHRPGRVHGLTLKSRLLGKN